MEAFERDWDSHLNTIWKQSDAGSLNAQLASWLILLKKYESLFVFFQSFDHRPILVYTHIGKDRHWNLSWMHGRTSNCFKNCLSKQSTALKSHQDPRQKYGRCKRIVASKTDKKGRPKGSESSLLLPKVTWSRIPSLFGVMFQQRVRHGPYYVMEMKLARDIKVHQLFLVSFEVTQTW